MSRAGLPALLVLLAIGAVVGARAAEFTPAGATGQARLLGPGGPDAQAVKAAVERDGVYAGPAIGAGACARCHPDVAAQWAASAHRFSSFANPYYTASARAFHAVRGPDGFRFCAACHDPALDVTGPLDALDDATLATPAAQAGIGCLLCHSIGEAPPPIGNGAYHARLDPVPIGEGHGARVRPAGIDDGRLCGSCHRVGLDAQVSGDRWRRGQDDHFGWADGPFGGGAAILDTPKPAGCVDCHMPRVAASAREKGARDGRIRDHRALGANIALAALRGDDAHGRATAAFVRDSVRIDLLDGGEGRVDVVLTNTAAGHPFPAGVNDSNQAWLEWRIVGADGAVLYESGVLRDGRLPEATHLVRAQPVDPQGDPLAERAVHDLRSVVFDTRLPPLQPRAVRLRMPAGAERLTVRLLYRQFDADYIAFACDPLPAPAVRARCAANPVMVVAEAAAAIGAVSDAEPEARLRHGLALADGLAADARRAEYMLRELARERPDDPRPLLGAAKAAWALGRTDAVLALLDRADARGAGPMSHRLRIAALMAAYRIPPARVAAERLATALPDARGTWIVLAILRGLDGDHVGALAAADRLLALDPQHPDGHYQRMLALRALQRPGEADARLLYLRYRRPDEAVLRLRKAFRARHPLRAPHLDAIPTWGQR